MHGGTIGKRTIFISHVMRWNGEIVRILQNDNLETVNAFIQNCKKGTNYPHLLESQFLWIIASADEPDQES